MVFSKIWTCSDEKFNVENVAKAFAYLIMHVACRMLQKSLVDFLLYASPPSHQIWHTYCYVYMCIIYLFIKVWNSRATLSPVNPRFWSLRIEHPGGEKPYATSSSAFPTIRQCVYFKIKKVYSATHSQYPRPLSWL